MSNDQCSMIKLLPCLLLLGACAEPATPNPPPPPPPPPGPVLHSIGDFTNPTFLAAPAGDTGRLFVTERIGRIRLLKHDALQARPFLDIVGKMSSTDENGLYSMAFHPQYGTNGQFYVFFTNLDGDIRVVRYLVSSNPDSADESAADTILAVPHPITGTTLPFGNHHGGQLQFGPDGKLYVSLGDGGCCGDPLQNGQRHHTLNAKILRINVDGATGYTVPADNPFVSLPDTSFPPEVWAWGFRNPWRFSFDRATGDLYIADVGDNSWEEVDVAAAPNAAEGLNYGWSIMEGTHCVSGAGCSPTGLTLPVIEYAHTNGACDVQGGYVYRGSVVTQLTGRYLYADYCANFVRSFTYSGGVATQSRDWPQLAPGGGGGIVSFGEDARGELYLMTYGGTVYRIVATP